MNFRQALKSMVPYKVIEGYRRRGAEAALSQRAKNQRDADSKGLRDEEYTVLEAVETTGKWLCRAQDMSTSRDGGVARHLSLNTGWSASYPETTGYIVPTFLDLAKRLDVDDYAARACRMLDWLLSIQLPNGAFQGGMITDSTVPVTFNTGQILLGLAAGAGAFESPRYHRGMVKAATWLRDTQDADGCWRAFPTPFASVGEKTYETHVSWGLLEAERKAPGNGFGDSALKQIRWAMSNVASNGWIRNCCLTDSARPLTHTLGYALRGIVEGYRISGDTTFLDAATRTGAGLRSCVQSNGFLAGRLDSGWRPAVKWACLTGSAQVAACFFELYLWTGDERWRDSGQRLVTFVRRTLITGGDAENVGGIAGSFPIDGGYCAYEYPNWAAKFFIDAQLAAFDVDEAIRKRG